MSETNASMQNETVASFSSLLASSAPVPGGGGASALAGALGAALGEMVANLTFGKKKYAAAEPEIREACARLTALREEMLEAIDGDAKAFAPLAAAYGIKDPDEKAAAIRAALPAAIEAPLTAMEKMAEALAPLSVIAEKGSRIAVSDAAAAAALLGSAIRAMSLNVFINTAACNDPDAVRAWHARADRAFEALSGFGGIYESVYGSLRRDP